MYNAELYRQIQCVVLVYCEYLKKAHTHRHTQTRMKPKHPSKNIRKWDAVGVHFLHKKHAKLISQINPRYLQPPIDLCIFPFPLPLLSGLASAATWSLSGQGLGFGFCFKGLVNDEEPW